MKISQAVINEVNAEVKNLDSRWDVDQGIFEQPFGIPDDEKGDIVYSKYESGGVEGGSCWDESNPQPYSKTRPKEHMAVLEILLMKLIPNIGYLQFKAIERLVKTNEETQWEYYGNSTNYVIEYIPLQEIERLLTEWENE